MEVRKRSAIKSVPYDDFKDNETLEQIATELNEGGANVVLGSLDAAINWGRSNSPWSLTFGTSCCGIEFMAIGCARYDMARFGWEVTRNSPRQADLIMCAGTITNKMAPVFKRLYDEMAEPKYVVAVGGCTISGGPFKKSYCVVRGINEIVPVDVYIPGCPPRPESIIYGMMQLQRKIKVEKFFGGANHKMNDAEREESMSRGGLHGLSNANFSHEKIGNKAPIIVATAPSQEEMDKLDKEIKNLDNAHTAQATEDRSEQKVADAPSARATADTTKVVDPMENMVERKAESKIERPAEMSSETNKVSE